MSDSSPLVRSSQAGGWWLDKLSNEDFDRLPREQKLVIVSDDPPPQAEKLARWVQHTAETKSVGDDEIYDVVLEYLCNPKVLRWLQEYTSYDFFGDARREEGFKALWALVAEVPSPVAHCLVARLPWECMGDEPPSEVLTWLETSPYLETLLWREDVPMLELRRELFFSNDPKHGEIKPAAVSHNFYFAPEQLSELFEQRSKLLDTLAAYCDFPVGGPVAEWTPVTVLALKESAWARHSDHFLVDENKLERKFKSSLAELNGSDRERGLRLLKIYRLAKKVVCWNRNLLKDEEFEPDLAALSEQLGFLTEKVVKYDTWGTFVGFAKAIDWRSDRFDHLLPGLKDVNTADDSMAEVVTRDGVNDALHKQRPTGATTQPTPENLAQRGSLLGNTIIVLEMVAALLTILFAVGGILDNEYRNFRSGVMAMAISAGVIVFAGSQLFRGSK